MKRYWYIVILIIVGMLLVSVYYATAYNQLNNLIKVANNGARTEFEGNNIISLNDFYMIQSVMPIDETDEYYINGGTFIHIKSIGLNKISFKCHSNYEVINAQNEELLQKVENNAFIVNMQYQNFQWIVDSVIQS